MEHMEMEIMNIIVNAGNARSNCIKAMKLATARDYEQAMALYHESKEALVVAHNTQTQLIQKEINGNKNELTLLMIHAQDHLMDALVMKDMTELFLQESETNYKKIKELEERLK